MPSQKRFEGFTFLELLIVIVLVAVVSATALPKFFGKVGVEELTTQDQVLAYLRLQQTKAMQDTSLFQAVTLTDLTLQLHETTLALQLYDKKVAGSAISSFWFNGLGQPSLGESKAAFSWASEGLRLEVQGALTTHVCIEPEGYIHRC